MPARPRPRATRTTAWSDPAKWIALALLVLTGCPGGTLDAGTGSTAGDGGNDGGPGGEGQEDDTGGGNQPFLWCPPFSWPEGPYDVIPDPDTISNIWQDATAVISTDTQQYPAALDPGDVCPATNGTDGIAIYVYRPAQTGTTDFPSEAMPMVVLQPGEGQSVADYRRLIESVVTEGFIVAGVQEVDAHDGNRDEMRDRFHCALRYLLYYWDPGESGAELSCRTALIGHGSGAMATHLAVPNQDHDGLYATGFSALTLDEVQIASIIEIAPRSMPSLLGPGYVDASDSLWGIFSVPVLWIGSATDNNWTNDVAYRAMNPWEAMSADYWFENEHFPDPQEATFARTKAAVWVFDAEPDAFGGGGTITPSQLMDAASVTDAEAREKAETIAAEYSTAWLRWHMLGHGGERFLFSGEAYPESVLEPAFWDYHPAYDDLLAAGCTDPGVDTQQECEAITGCWWEPSGPSCVAVDCLDPALELDTQAECEALPGCWWQPTWQHCVRQPLIKHAYTVDQQFRKVITGFPDLSVSPAFYGAMSLDSSFPYPDQIEPLSPFELSGQVPVTDYTHLNNALAVRWADTGEDPAGDITFTFYNAQDLAAYNYLSMRVGIVSGATGDENECYPASDTPLSFNVRLVRDDAQTPVSRTVAVSGITQQEVQSITAYPGETEEEPICAGRWFLETVRIPLRDFCWQTERDLFTLDNVEQIRIYIAPLPNATSPESFVINIDNVEFTNDPFDVAGTCGVPSAWSCEATLSLAATEESCQVAPVSSACPNGQDVQDDVDLPIVSSAFGGPHSGWAIYASFVQDPDNPTNGELAMLGALCSQACADEFAGRPHVSANCFDNGVFETPALIPITPIGPFRGIGESFEDGSGLVSGQSLSCDLESDCCLDMNEDVCPAASGRVTLAETQLGRGEEYVVSVSGTINVESAADMALEEADVAGTVGYSRCEAGNANGPCAFYLGSVHLELTEPLVLPVECSGAMVQLPLDVVEVDLVQPAMGIDFEDNAWKAFPAGALLWRTHVEAGPVTVDDVAPNEIPVALQALDGWLGLNGLGGFYVDVNVLCGTELKSLHAWFVLSAVDALEQPPLVSIDMPSSVSCGTWVDLDADTADPDGDHDSLRWEVDGVLLEESVSVIEVNESHTIRAILADLRGATTEDVHVIDCTTP